MTMESPDGLDRDLFAPRRGDATVHDLDGSVCRRCGQTHDFREDGVAVPDEVRAEISKLLDKLPAEVLHNAVIVAKAIDPEEVFSNIRGFADKADGANTQGPYLRAVAEVLDAMSDGAVSKAAACYDAERRVLATALVATTLDRVREDLATKAHTIVPDAGEDQVASFDQLIVTVLEQVHAELARRVTQYRETCQTWGRVPDEGVCRGEGPSPGPFAALTSVSDAVANDDDEADD